MILPLCAAIISCCRAPFSSPLLILITPIASQIRHGSILPLSHFDYAAIFATPPLSPLRHCQLTAAIASIIELFQRHFSR